MRRTGRTWLVGLILLGGLGTGCTDASAPVASSSGTRALDDEAPGRTTFDSVIRFGLPQGFVPTERSRVVGWKSPQGACAYESVVHFPARASGEPHQRVHSEERIEMLEVASCTFHVARRVVRWSVESGPSMSAARDSIPSSSKWGDDGKVTIATPREVSGVFRSSLEESALEAPPGFARLSVSGATSATSSPPCAPTVDMAWANQVTHVEDPVFITVNTHRQENYWQYTGICVSAATRQAWSTWLTQTGWQLFGMGSDPWEWGYKTRTSDR